MILALIFFIPWAVVLVFGLWLTFFGPGSPWRKL